MREIKSRSFTNGTVYALETKDGMPIEVTDTFLPYYTKDISSHDNKLKEYYVANRSERWMIGVSCMSGCPVGCKFCATGSLPKWRNLTAYEIVKQVLFVIEKTTEYEPSDAKEFKINYTRMGEPFLNIEAVKEAIVMIDEMFPFTTVHHYISTVGLQGSDFSWIKDNVTLQLSLHSLDEDRRHDLIPINNLMSIEELGAVRTDSDLKTTINLTLVDLQDFDIKKLSSYFTTENFFIKISPINTNVISDKNNMGEGIIVSKNLL